MRFIYVMCLMGLAISQTTFLHLDQKGAQSFAELLVKSLEGFQYSLDIDYDLNFLIGSASIHGLSIYDISYDPSQITIKFNEKLNSIDVDLHLHRMVVSTQIKEKLLGITTINSDVTFQITNSKFKFQLVLDISEDNAIRVNLYKNKFKKFHIGRVKIINSKNLWHRLINGMTSEAINLLIDGLQGVVKKKLAETINNYGSQIPSSFAFPHPYEDAVIQMPLAQRPQINENSLEFDFHCGSNYVHHDEETEGFIHLTVSEACVNHILTEFYKVNNIFDVEAVAQQLSDIMEIDSKTLAQLFPGFRMLENPKDVAFKVSLNTQKKPHAKFNDGYGVLEMPIKMDIYLAEIKRLRGLDKKIVLDRKIGDNLGEYYTQLNATAIVNLDVLKEFSGFVGNLNNIDLNELSVADEEKMDLKAWNYNQNVAMQFGRSYANQVIYTLMVKPQQYFREFSMNMLDVEIQDQEIDIRMQF